jgi:hypothetical protein
MKAYLWRGGYILEVNVKVRTIDASGLVRIEDEYGVIYETHLSNVVFVDGRGKAEVTYGR